MNENEDRGENERQLNPWTSVSPFISFILTMEETLNPHLKLLNLNSQPTKPANKDDKQPRKFNNILSSALEFATKTRKN